MSLKSDGRLGGAGECEYCHKWVGNISFHEAHHCSDRPVKERPVKECIKCGCVPAFPDLVKYPYTCLTCQQNMSIMDDAHICEYTSDGGSCIKCGKTISEQIFHKKPDAVIEDNDDPIEAPKVRPQSKTPRTDKIREELYANRRTGWSVTDECENLENELADARESMINNLKAEKERDRQWREQCNISKAKAEELEKIAWEVSGQSTYNESTLATVCKVLNQLANIKKQLDLLNKERNELLVEIDDCKRAEYEKAVIKLNSELIDAKKICAELFDIVETFSPKNPIVERLKAGKEYVHKSVLDRAEYENRKFREAFSLLASNIGNGSQVSPDCSLSFLTIDLPNEVKLYCKALRDENDKLKSANKNTLPTCSVCGWSSHNCLNISGDSVNSKWVCHGCIKRAFDGTLLI